MLNLVIHVNTPIAPTPLGHSFSQLEYGAIHLVIYQPFSVLCKLALDLQQAQSSR